jgi:NitT/TauT family transport system substrate-binding protein
MRRLLSMSLAAALALSAMAVAGQGTDARADTIDIRFTLDWVMQGPHGPFIRAKNAGYYEEEGLNVIIHPSDGSGDAVNRIASGTHEMGFPDINALVEFNANNPDSAIQAVLMGYEQGPFSIFTMRDSGIEEVKDLEGRSLGAPAFDASMRLFPAVVETVGLDMDQIRIVNMSPALRETMLIRREVDAITGHNWSSMLNLRQAGVSEDEVRYFLYSDLGLDFYGNAVAVSRAFQDEHPEAIRGFIRATLRGLRDIVENPELAIEAALDFEPLLDADIERARLEMAMECCILTENVRQHGYGGIDPERMARALEHVALSFGLERTPSVEEMFNDAYLPPAEERMID